MNRSRFLTMTAIFFAGVFLFFALPTQAHKLNVFSWTGENKIYGEAFFSGGRKAKNVPVHVQNAESLASLLTTQTDEEGKFQFTPPQQAVQQNQGLLITVDTGDGHRGEWLLEADEYLIEDSAPPPSSQTKQPGSELVTLEDIRQIVLQELNRELIPIKRHLAEDREKEANPRDIIGGIGCILGLAGIFAWFQAKKKKKKASADG
ncbi:Nickel transport protein [Candidatus Electrothrix laxa]